MKKTVFLASLLVVLLELSAPPAWAGVAAKGYDNVIAAARESLWRAITSGGAGSATVAVMDGGRIVYSEGFGVADRSSGLPGSTFTFGYARGDDPQELLLETLKESHLKHDPGALSIYCNDGFTLAERIVERLSGKPFLAFLKERVFRPLAMNDTGPSLGERGDEGAVYYAPLSGKRYPPEWVPVYGAGGLSSTAEDLCRFGDSFTSGGRESSPKSPWRRCSAPSPPLSWRGLRGRRSFTPSAGIMPVSRHSGRRVFRWWPRREGRAAIRRTW